MNPVILQPGDIFLTRGKSLLSRAIRICSRTIGEKRTKVNHAGIIVTAGGLQNCIVIEASYKVLRHRLWEAYGPRKTDEVAIFRPKNLIAADIGKIVSMADQQVGKKYGYFKIAGHFLDWLFLGIYFFRRIFNNGKYPICSWLVAHAFSVAGKDFGVPAGAAQPDDIWDFVIKNTEKYEEIHPLSLIWP
mgnify:CR=1 FL=1